MLWRALGALSAFLASFVRDDGPVLVIHGHVAVATSSLKPSALRQVPAAANALILH
jgi:hypothetical protein